MASDQTNEAEGETGEAPNFAKMNGKELDAFVAHDEETGKPGIAVPEEWDKMKVAEKREYLASLYRAATPADIRDIAHEGTADAPADADLIAEVRRFKSWRTRMSARDVVHLARRLGVEGWDTLPYDKLRIAMKKAIRRL